MYMISPFILVFHSKIYKANEVLVRKDINKHERLSNFKFRLRIMERNRAFDFMFVFDHFQFYEIIDILRNIGGRVTSL